MPSNIKRNTAIGIVAALAVGGGGIAVAASTTSTTSKRSAGADQQKAFIADAAKRLSVTPEQLTAALKGAFGDQLDQAVTDGKLSQKQADAIKARIATGNLPFGGPGHRGPGGPGFGGGPMGGHGILDMGLDAAATYLGLTKAELQAKLTKGTSLADVATAQGKTASGLEDALVAAAKTQLDKAVTAGKITAAQRDEIERDLASHIKDIVENAGPGHDHERGGKPGGPRGFGGPGGPPGGFLGRP